jgi:hypothetical protein
LASTRLSAELNRNGVREQAYPDCPMYRTYATYRGRVTLSQELREHLGLPRGCLGEVCDLLTNLDIRPSLERLQTLADPANAPLPIAFDGTGALGVDLLCDDARLTWIWTARST